MAIIGSTSRAGWSKISGFLPQTATTVVDQNPSGTIQVSYIITVFSQANSAYKRLNIDIMNVNGSYFETIYGKINGGNADIVVATNNNSGILELVITNNETHDLQIRLAKLALS